MHDTTAAKRLAALGNPTRLKLFRLLVKAGEAGLNVGEIQKHSQIAPSTLAHHLSALHRSGLIIQERHSREVISKANYAAVDTLISYLKEDCCAGVVRGDRTTAA